MVYDKLFSYDNQVIIFTIMQNGQILILLVPDKKIIFYLDTWYIVIMHWIPLQFYTDMQNSTVDITANRILSIGLAVDYMHLPQS